MLQLAGLVDQRLGSKLISAYRLRHGVVALTSAEREQVVVALAHAPPGFEELRAALLR